MQQQVLTNKDLDLPTQQELLAQFRCDEIAVAVTEAFNLSSKAVRRPVEAGSVVDGLGALMRDWLGTALGVFLSYWEDYAEDTKGNSTETLRDIMPWYTNENELTSSPPYTRRSHPSSSVN